MKLRQTLSQNKWKIEIIQYVLLHEDHIHNGISGELYLLLEADKKFARLTINYFTKNVKMVFKTI